MLKRHWGIFLALGVSALVSAFLYATLRPRQPDLPGYEYSKGDSANYQPGGSACQPSVLAAIRDRREASRERERCAQDAEDHRLQSDDLVQQTRSANAAEAQANLSYHLAWLGLYGTIGGFLTLVAATAAAMYARDAARAAHAGLDQSREVADVELRPWLQMDLKPKGYALVGTQAVFRYELVIKNIGKSVAREVFAEGQLRNFGPEQESEIPDYFSSPFVPRPGMRGRTILPQGQVTLKGALVQPRENVGVVITDEAQSVLPVVAIRVDYRWGEDNPGQTAESYGIAAASDDGEWRPIILNVSGEVDARASVTRMWFDRVI